MRDLPRHSNFGMKLREPRRIAVDVGREEFQRDGLSELEVVGEIDLAQPPRPRRRTVR